MKTLSNYKNNPFAYHQIKIALRTLEMNDIFANIMGKPNKEESRKILKKYEIKLPKEE